MDDVVKRSPRVRLGQRFPTGASRRTGVVLGKRAPQVYILNDFFGSQPALRAFVLIIDLMTPVFLKVNLCRRLSCPHF